MGVVCALCLTVACLAFPQIAQAQSLDATHTSSTQISTSQNNATQSSDAPSNSTRDAQNNAVSNNSANRNTTSSNAVPNNVASTHVAPTHAAQTQTTNSSRLLSDNPWSNAFRRTIVFVDGNQVLFVRSAKVGDTVLAPLPKTPAGMRFAGWETDGDAVYAPGANIITTRDMTLRSVWMSDGQSTGKAAQTGEPTDDNEPEQPTTYTVTYRWRGLAPHNTNLPDSSTVVAGQKPQLDDIYTEGYQVKQSMIDASGIEHQGIWFFLGWQAQEGLDSQGRATGNVVYTGGWSFAATSDTGSGDDRGANPDKPDKPDQKVQHTVILHISAQEARSVLVTDGGSYFLPTLQDTVAKYFAGWHVSGSTTAYQGLFTNIRTNLDFEPIWKPKTFTVSYQWQGAAPAGMSLPAMQHDIRYGDRVVIPHFPLQGYSTRSEHNSVAGTWVFVGWQPVGGVSQQGTLTANATVEGVWDFVADAGTQDTGNTDAGTEESGSEDTGSQDSGSPWEHQEQQNITIPWIYVQPSSRDRLPFSLVMPGASSRANAYYHAFGAMSDSVFGKRLLKQTVNESAQNEQENRPESDTHTEDELVESLSRNREQEQQYRVSTDLNEQSVVPQASEFQKATRSISIGTVAAGTVVAGVGGTFVFTGIRRRFFLVPKQ